MTAIWSPKLDRDVDTIGMIKQLTVSTDVNVYAEF
jgi:hypothetical protein